LDKGERGVAQSPLPSNIPLDGLASLSFNAANNRVTSANGNTNFEHDPAGNQTKAVINSSGTIQQYRYDAAGRLAQVLDGGGATLATHSYGASNQRLMSVEGSITTFYGWDGGQIIAEYAPSGATDLSFQTGYVYLGGRLLATVNAVAGSGTRFHHPDRLGTNVVTDQSNGELVTKQMGMPFGTQQPSGAFGGDNSWQHSTKNNPSKKRFTSYDRSDATGLDYAVNRFYSAAQGRFTQVDPIEMGAASLSDPQTLNLYSYCGNDPINHVDPDGLFWGKLFGWAGKIFKAVAIAVFVAGAILLTAGLAVAAIAGSWAAGSAFFQAFSALMGFFVKHKVIAGIIGIGSAGGFLTPKINGGGVSGVSSFVSGGDNVVDTDFRLVIATSVPGPWWDKVKDFGRRAWDWLTTDGLEKVASFSAGFGDTITFGGTEWIRRKWYASDASEEQLKDSNYYTAGEYSGYAWEIAMGGAVAGRAAGYEVTVNYYPNAAGGGVNVLKSGVRKFAVDWHRFKTKGGSLVNRIHTHFGKTKSQLKKHRNIFTGKPM